MLRLIYVIIINIFKLPAILRMMSKMTENPDIYSMEERYAYIQYVIGLLHKTGGIRTEVYGTENLPKEGGYMMYPNHQGRYDAYGLIGTHEKTCSIVMDEAKSHIIFVRHALDLVAGKRLDKKDNRQALTIINEIAKEVKQGRRFILFPEGEYHVETGNTLGDFKAGCFKIVLKSKVPIVPVVLIDSFKPFNTFQLGEIITQVHYLKPIFYEEYQGMKTDQIAAMVKERIQQKMNHVLAQG